MCLNSKCVIGIGRLGSSVPRARSARSTVLRVLSTRQNTMALSRLSRILLLTRDVPAGVQFFGEGVGLALRLETDGYAELELSPPLAASASASESATAAMALPLPGPALALQGVEREADCSTGYSPIIQIDVEDLDAVIARVLMQGGRLDGAISHHVHGKAASVRSPDGHMVGLFEPNTDV